MSSSTRRLELPLRTLQVRALVLALGEACQPPWQPTQFLSRSGLSILGRVFPRTAFAAAVNAGTLAAQVAHDRAIGRGRVFHLFRLPAAVEDDIRKRLMTTESAEITAMVSACGGTPCASWRRCGRWHRR